jgi:hypothetical protein
MFLNIFLTTTLSVAGTAFPNRDADYAPTPYPEPPTRTCTPGTPSSSQPSNLITCIDYLVHNCTSSLSIISPLSPSLISSFKLLPPYLHPIPAVIADNSTASWGTYSCANRTWSLSPILNGDGEDNWSAAQCVEECKNCMYEYARERLEGGTCETEYGMWT